MKKLLLLISIIFLSFTSSYASHLMGAEITYVYVSGNNYEVTISIYRDCSGINLSTTSANVTFQSASCSQNFSIPLPYIQTNDVSQVCPGQATTCNGGTVPGTQQFIYRGIVSLQPCSDWIMRWNQGTRNPATTNLVNPGGVNLYIQNTLNNTAGFGVNNNSPQFFNLPTPYLCANNLAIYSHAASDIDGDSLYYQFNNPLTTPGPPGTPIPFTPGYSLLQPMITSSGMNLDSLTGEMCFTPSQNQTSVVSVMVREYRNGLLIGTQIREMQVIVTAACLNSNPTTGASATCGGAGGLFITVAGPSVDSLDQNSISMCPSDSLCFQINFSDPDANNINVATNLASAIPGATFTVIGNNTPNPVGTFCWIPTALDSGLNVFAIVLTDDACPISGTQTFTYDITVFDEPYAGPDDTICESETVQLTASGGATYTWFDPITNTPIPVGPSFSCNPCFNPVATPLVSTSYYVVSSLSAFCNNTDTVDITVIPGYTLTSGQSDTNICVGDVINFNTTPSIAGAYNFLWTSNTGVPGTPTLNSTTDTFNTAGLDTVLVTVSNANCSLQDSLFVNISPVPNINIATLDTLLNCDSTVQLMVDLGAAPIPNNFSFNWNFGTTLDDDSIQNPIATPNQGITDYIVIVTDTLGNCFDTDTVEVRSCCIIPTVTVDSVSCFGLDDGKIVVAATALNSDFTIEFRNNDVGMTLLQTSSGNPADSILNLAPGSYIVNIIDTIGCSYTEIITITEPFPVTLTNVTLDTIICVNGTKTIFGTPNGVNAPVLVWDNNLIGSGPHVVNPTASSTTYNVYALDTNNCVSDTQSVTIDLLPPITINSFEIMRDTICIGDTTSIRVDATGGGTNLYYTWMNGNGGIIGTTALNQFIITPSYHGEIFSVTVSDSCSTTTQTDSVTSNWANIVLPSYTVSDIAGCYNQILPTIINTTPGLANMASVLWDFGDGETDNFPFGTPFTHGYDNPGIYDITLIVTDQAGCVWDTVISQFQIDAHDYPNADFMWNPDPTDYLNAEITFDNLSTENLFNEWIFITDAQYTSNDIDPVFLFPQNQPGSYEVILKVTNEFGCQDSVIKKVVIDDVFLFYIPTGFTPDGDGLNDQFKVVGEGLDLSSFKMSVFNKWGELIFESNNPDFGWNGTRNGDLVADGVYIWKIEAKEAHSSIVHNKDGFVTIIK